MKTLFYTFILAISLISCSSASSEYEKVITDFLETKNGIKTDLQIEYKQLDVSDISVADSIAILKEQFESERNKKMQSIEQRIKDKEKSISEQKDKLETAKGSATVVAKSMINIFEKELQEEKVYLDKTQNWKPDYLNRYENRNPSDILAKKADITISYFNPKLQAKQEMSMYIVLSPDGKQCYGAIKK